MRSLFLIGALSFVLVSCEPATKPEAPATPPATTPPAAKPTAPAVPAVPAAPGDAKAAPSGAAAVLGAAKDAAKPVPAAVAAAAKLEIACAKCVYKMADVTTCTAAVKVAGKTLLLSGGNVDAHAVGLCNGPKQATIEGKEEGGKFVATKVDIAK